jgi:uncharacterized protein YkwD
MIVRASFRHLLLLVSLALAACSGNTAAAGGPSDPALDEDEQAAFQQINTLRQAAGVSQVAICTSLNVSAAAHADEMRDANYLAETSPVTGSNVRTRACAAGYNAACGTNIPMGELVAQGNGAGVATADQWNSDTIAHPILVQPGFVVAGIARSFSANQVWWSLDLSSQTDPSCH